MSDRVSCSGVQSDDTDLMVVYENTRCLIASTTIV